MYANSRFMLEVNEWGMVTKEAMPGDKISQNDLGVSDDEWKALIDRGLVLENYPKDLHPDTPLSEYYRENPDAAESKAEEPEPPKEEKSAEPPKPQAAAPAVGQSAENK